MKLHRDIFGMAINDYLEGNYSEDILTETGISGVDSMSVPYLFRDYHTMPLLEQIAMDKAKGKVLDVGCGAGSHSLYLQQKGLEVTSIDVSSGAIEACKKRGLKNARNIHLLELEGEKFDTILLMMNGTGIFKTLKEAPVYLQHLKTLLYPDGQILVDSTDLKYMYRSFGLFPRLPKDKYYGELDFIIRYKGFQSPRFPWLYLDQKTFKKLCKENQLHFEVLRQGRNYDYLARISFDF